MKQFLIIGMDTFGHILCRKLAKTRCEIMIADIDPNKLDDLLSVVDSAKCGDCTSEAVLRSYGIPDFDVCFVCVGGHFQASLQISSLLKELGAKKVITKADNAIQAKFLLRNGADQIIYPEDEVAERIATRESNDRIFDAVELGGDYAIYELMPHKRWIGKTLKELNFRAKYKMIVVAVKDENGEIILPHAEYKFQPGHHMLVVSKPEDVEDY